MSNDNVRMKIAEIHNLVQKYANKCEVIGITSYYDRGLEDEVFNLKKEIATAVAILGTIAEASGREQLEKFDEDTHAIMFHKPE